MSNLFPGGCRSSYGRIFSPEAIKRVCSTRDHSCAPGIGSIADQPHEHKREIARRLRQFERSCFKLAAERIRIGRMV